ncbi:hypothetical protein VNO77_37552 [Canavalia gladiata]|uniref:Uncharacterized protein n=1 Tax=Canavalia gladiata TaxID=3824 RepID=A0AAN9K911_CANGL
MDPNNKGFYEYDLVPSDEPLKQHKNAPTVGEKKRKKNKGKHFSKKIFWICFSDVVVESNLVNNEKIKEEQKKGESKVKDKMLLSNVETEPDKVLSAMEMENMKNKSCFLVCCSDIQVIKANQES